MKKPKQQGRYHDHGTEVRIARGEVIVENNIARVRKKTVLQHHFDMCGLKSSSDDEMVGIVRLEAGQMLQRDYAIAFQSKSMLAVISEVRGHYYTPIDKNTALDRYRKAMDMLRPANRDKAAYAVLIADETLSQAKITMPDFWDILDRLDRKYHEFRKDEQERVRKLWDKAHERFETVK